MAKVAKIAISLPEDLLKAVEEKCIASGESRSHFFRRAVETLWQQECSASYEYIEGYRRMPESLEEIEAAHRAGRLVLEAEPWE